MLRGPTAQPVDLVGGSADLKQRSVQLTAEGQWGRARRPDPKRGVSADKNASDRATPRWVRASLAGAAALAVGFERRLELGQTLD
jgi:hypothetical protein